jgi:8-oxo-dGTP diphosphatase
VTDTHTQQGTQTATLAVSTVIFALRPNDRGELSLTIPLVRRIRAPFDGMLALPGGPLACDEDLDAAAARNLADTTGLEPKYLEQLYAFGNVDRSVGHVNTERVVSIVYWALVGSKEARQVIQDDNVHWFTADALPELAFDHNIIVDYALNRLRSKIEYARIAHGFLGETFTLAQLREVYEAVLGRALDPGNFRRTVESSGEIVATGKRLMGTKHRPPQLYRYQRNIPTPFSNEKQETADD